MMANAAGDAAAQRYTPFMCNGQTVEMKVKHAK